MHRNHVHVFESDFVAFEEFLHNDLRWGFFSSHRFVEAMGIDLRTLAAWADVAIDIDVELENGELHSFQEASLRVLRAVFEVTGDVEKAIEWYKYSPLVSFDNKAPRELVSAGRTDALIKHISSLRAGFAG